MVEITKELDCDLQTLNELISNDKYFSIVTDKAIYRVKNSNNELMRILLCERKQIMAQQIQHNREEIQWRLI